MSRPFGVCIVLFATVLAGAANTSCGTDEATEDARNPLICQWPEDAPTGESCVCFDGDLRCHVACPMDLSAACTAGSSCADFSGGSAGGDCACSCDQTGAWVCHRDFSQETCIPN